MSSEDIVPWTQTCSNLVYRVYTMTLRWFCEYTGNNVIVAIANFNIMWGKSVNCFVQHSQKRENLTSENYTNLTGI